MKNKYILIKFLLVALLILTASIWIVGAVVLNSETSPNELKHSYALENYRGQFVLQGNRIQSEFRAKDNFMGIIYLKIDKYNKPDFKLEDEIIFRLKNKNSDKWLVEQRYRSGYFENYSLFPFGFPIIEDSKNKLYEFEIVSMKGNYKNALKISSNSPQFISAHYFPVNEIKSSPLNYLLHKSINTATRSEAVLASLIFALPFLIVLLITFYIFKRRILGNRFVILGFLFILIDIFLINNFYFGLFFSLVIIFAAGILINNLSYKLSSILGFSLIVLWFLFIILGIGQFTGKLNIWAYFFISFAVMQIYFGELEKVKKNKEITSIYGKIKKYYAKIQLRK